MADQGIDRVDGFAVRVHRLEKWTRRYQMDCVRESCNVNDATLNKWIADMRDRKTSHGRREDAEDVLYAKCIAVFSDAENTENENGTALDRWIAELEAEQGDRSPTGDAAVDCWMCSRAISEYVYE